MIPWHPYSVPWATPCARERFALVMIKAGSIEWSPGLVVAIVLVVACFVGFVLLMFALGSRHDSR
jgi:hypothetical protein